MNRGYLSERSDRLNYLFGESNRLLSIIASSIVLHEINQCDDIYSCINTSCGNNNFQYGISRLTDKGVPVNIKIGANLSPIRQSSRFMFSRGTLDIYSSYDTTDFVKIKIHRGLDSCTITTSKRRDITLFGELSVVKELLGKYMSSTNIPMDSDLYRGYKDYISMIDEMSVLLSI